MTRTLHESPFTFSSRSGSVDAWGARSGMMHEGMPMMNHQRQERGGHPPAPPRA